LTAGEPLAIAAESIRTMIAKLRAWRTEPPRTDTVDVSADSAKKVEISQHHETGFAIVTVTCFSKGDKDHFLTILETVDSVLTDNSFNHALGILFDYREAGLHGQILAAGLRSVLGVVTHPNYLNSRCAMVLDPQTDLALFPMSLFASEAHGHSHNFRVFIDEQQATKWLVPGDHQQPTHEH
jgi:hypothetical protein